jgi:hypothetical protein
MIDIQISGCSLNSQKKEELMKTIIVIWILGISTMLGAERGFSLESSGSDAGTIFIIEKGTQNKHDRDPLEKGDSEKDLPTIPPPVNDPEMVIKPDAPPDPDAVVIPPPIDSEMAVDPETREPLTAEELEQLNKLGKENPEPEPEPEPEQKRFPEK